MVLLPLPLGPTTAQLVPARAKGGSEGRTEGKGGVVWALCGRERVAKVAKSGRLCAQQRSSAFASTRVDVLQTQCASWGRKA